MFVKRSQMLKNIEDKIKNCGPNNSQTAEKILELVEMFMEPKLRPLTNKEVDEHVLVKQVHESRKDEVRNFVRNLDYEMKREFVPEDL
jgi:hypothetical protein